MTILSRIATPVRARKTVSAPVAQKPAPSSLGPQVAFERSGNTVASDWSRVPIAPVRGAQCKLEVGSPTDPLEHEADRVADHVMRMPVSGSPGPGIGNAGSAGPVQRACAACNGENDDEKIRRKRIDPEDEVHGKLTGTPPPPSAALEGTLRSLGAGQPLPSSERAFFEPRFGHDFSRVRIHAGPVATGVARELRARALTRGSDVVFGAGEFAPGTWSGRHLLAHELTHVVQQAQGASPIAQRAPLVTPEPKTPPPAKPALTTTQITAAIRYNQSRFDAARTKQIQSLIGRPATGTWVDDDIIAIADIQERYALYKDGMVGPSTLVFLDKETGLEKLPKTDDNCPLAFSVAVDKPTVGPVVGGQRSITGHFKMEAQFSSYCGCADYTYRQFVRGHWKRVRGGVTTDLSNTFTHHPAGALTTNFAEDGNTTTAALNFGHREQANEGTLNGYFNDAKGTTANQASGCFYLGDDTPGGPDSVVSGDVFDILVAFRGEIRRKGTVVETKYWSAIDGKFRVP